MEIPWQRLGETTRLSYNPSTNKHANGYDEDSAAKSGISREGLPGWKGSDAQRGDSLHQLQSERGVCRK
jgi:hypothetical protein